MEMTMGAAGIVCPCCGSVLPQVYPNEWTVLKSHPEPGSRRRCEAGGRLLLTACGMARVQQTAGGREVFQMRAHP